MKSPTDPLTLSLIIASVLYFSSLSSPSIQSVSQAIQINIRDQNNLQF